MVLGYTQEDLVEKKTITDIILPQYVAAFIEQISHEIDTYHYNTQRVPAIVIDVLCKHKNGSEIWVEISATLKFDNRGLFSEIVGSMQVITKRKKLNNNY